MHGGERFEFGEEISGGRLHMYLFDGRELKVKKCGGKMLTVLL